MLKKISLILFAFFCLASFSQSYKYHTLVKLGSDLSSAKNYCGSSSVSGTTIKWNIYLNEPLLVKNVYKIPFEGTNYYYYIKSSSYSRDGDADEDISGSNIVNACEDSSSPGGYKYHRLISIGSNLDEAKSYCHYNADRTEGEKYGVWTSYPLNEGKVYKVSLGNSIKYYFVVTSSNSGVQDANEVISESYNIQLMNFCDNLAAFPYLGNENYVLKTSPQVAIKSTNNFNTPSQKSITYFDGLGRPKQQIAINQSPHQKDVVSHIEYDAMGRQAKQYLPYASTSTNGYFKTTAKAETLNYYRTNYPSDVNSTVPNPYSEVQFDGSPLNRAVKQGAPGYDWRLGGGHEEEFKYQANTNRDVRKYYVTTALLGKVFNPTLQLNTSSSNNYGYYNAGELYKTITLDENHTGTNKINTTEEYKNKQGQIILKRTYITNSAKADTYYVYDDFGNLTYVLPPKAKAHSAKPDAVELSELCYQYKYDDHSRLAEKKIPGKGWQYVVYDKLNRPVLTQEANYRNSRKWMFTKYDSFGRIVYTGTYTHSSILSQSQMQTYFDNLNSSSTKMYESKLTTSGVQGSYYSNYNFPTTNIELLTINYYDNYTFNRRGATTSVSNVYGINSTNRLKGLATGSRVKVLGTNSWITAVTYYDEKARPIYMYTKNDFLLSTDIIKYKLDFVGKILETTTTHNKTDDTLPSITTVDRFTYDHAARMTKHTQTLAGRTEVIVENTYDNIGQLNRKSVGGKISNTRLQNIDYSYNIRGWVNQINNTANLGDDLFAFKINYNKPTHGAFNLFNGNISETEWKTKNDNRLRWYKYSYDPLNRIKSAIDNSNRYSLSNVLYDENGNITRLQRRGHINSGATSFGLMDNLQYTYSSRSNKLNRVQELPGGNITYGFKNGSNSTIEYRYDVNGNMISDANKGISSITYNHLNLPEIVTIAGKNIKYTYDATGIKLRKIVNNSLVTEYAGNYIYKKDNTNNGLKTLEFFNHPEGYVTPKTVGGFKYVYHHKDHLGNVRLSYTDDNDNARIDGVNELIEENNYYPFGLEHKGYNNVVNGVENNYKTYQGQEHEKELGKNTYAFQWRDYDPVIARFNKIDRFSEKYYDQSPYHFTKNNPIVFNEVKGDSIIVSFRTGFLGIFGKKVTLTYDADNKQWNGADGKQYTGKTNKFVDKVLGDLKKNQENILGNEIVSNLANDKLNHFIKRGDPNKNKTTTDNIYYNGSNSTDQKIFQGGKSGSTPGYVVLGHEMAHKYSGNLGVKNWPWFGVGTANARGVDEYNAMYYENVLRGSNGLPLRNAYTESKGNLQGVILNSSGVLQRPPTLLTRRQTSTITTMPVVHSLLIINKFLNRW